MQKTNGFTLIDVLVGTVIVLIVFLGIFGAYQLGLKVVGLSKAKITATALANQKIEMARNLSYDDVGTVGGIPPGTIAETETLTRNNIDYTVKTTVVYIDDPFDGVAPDDTLPNDYKRIKVKVSWPGRLGGEVVLITDVAPKGIETTEGGGTLYISVFNASGIGVAQASLHLVNSLVDPAIDAWYQTNDNGEFVIPGAPTSTEAYQITVSKTGYSIDRTYSRDEVANPSKPQASVYEGQLTEISFSIDKVSSFSIDTLSPGGTGSFADSFLDESKIVEKLDVVISGGEVNLATTSPEYVSSGYLISQTITPSDLTQWDEFSFTDFEPAQTQISYQILYASGTEWFLIPDEDLPGNSMGFGISPVDLSSLSTTTYSQLRLKGNFSTNDVTVSPTLYDWQLTWLTSTPTPIPNVTFKLEGAKIIGTDLEDNPVYKYSQEHSSDSSGHIDIANLEWDSYSFYVDKEITGLDLISTDPAEPVSLLPNTLQEVDLYLKAENTLSVTVKDANTLLPIFGASVRVYSISLGYDKTLPTDEEGKAFFIPLEAATYNLEITASGYMDLADQVSVSGTTTKTVNLISLP